MWLLCSKNFFIFQGLAIFLSLARSDCLDFLNRMSHWNDQMKSASINHSIPGSSHSGISSDSRTCPVGDRATSSDLRFHSPGWKLVISASFLKGLAWESPSENLSPMGNVKPRHNLERMQWVKCYFFFPVFRVLLDMDPFLKLCTEPFLLFFFPGNIFFLIKAPQVRWQKCPSFARRTNCH